MCRLKKAMIASGTLWSLLDELIAIEANTRASRDEDRAIAYGDELPGNSRRQKEVMEELEVAVTKFILIQGGGHDCGLLKAC